MSAPALLPLIETQFLGNAVGVLYTVESGVANSMVQFNTILLANQDTQIHLVTLYKVPSGGAPATSNIVLPAVPVPPQSLMVIGCAEGLMVLPTGATLRGFADLANTVTITAHGLKYL